MQKKHTLLFLGFLLLVQVLYHPLIDGGFVTDFTGLLRRYDGQSAWNILDSFGFPALQPVLNFFLYIFYQNFGTWCLPWYLIYSLLFTFNGFLLYLLVDAIGKQFNLRNSQMVAICTAILFLISPYQVEVLFWRVLFNFLSVTTYIFTALLLAAKYSEHPKRKYFWGIHIVFLLGLFTFELILILPFFITTYAIVYYLEYRQVKSIRRMFTHLILPQLAGIGGWILLTKAVVGNYIGHYGAEMHLRFDVFDMVGTFLKYFNKHFFFLRYLRVDDNKWYSYLEQPAVVLFFILLLLFSMVFLILRWKKVQSDWKLAFLSFLWAGIALLPILNLYFQTLLSLENDRYGYLAWAFFAWFLVLVLHKIFPKWIFLALFLIYSSIHIYYNQKTVNWAVQSTEVHNGLLENFQYSNHSEIYLLGFVDNLKGVYIFRDYSKNNYAFSDALKYIKQDSVQGEIYEVAQFNMITPMDSLKATVDTSGRIRLTFNHWGSWWWRGGIGASSYETDKLKVEVKDLMLYITPKNPAEDAIFLYQVGNYWVELKYPENGNYQPIRAGPD